jgi:hypothetical protein
MRATISFETDIDQVEGTMAVLACSQEHNLRAAADLLSNFTVLDGTVLDTITEVLRLLDMSAGQLRQYQQMMVSFERSRFETILPQPAAAVAATVATENPPLSEPPQFGPEFFPPDLHNRMNETRKLFDSFAGFKETMANATSDPPSPSVVADQKEVNDDES